MYEYPTVTQRKRRTYNDPILNCVNGEKGTYRFSLSVRRGAPL